MNKQDLVNAIAAEAGITKADSERALNATTEAIKSSLSKGQGVQLIGFGSFSVVQRDARTGRNPQTGKPITIKAKKVAKFSAGKALKDAVN